MMEYSAPPVMLPPTKPDVPAGWRCEWSDQYQKFYYVHESTGDSSWNPPIPPPQHLRRKAVPSPISYQPQQIQQQPPVYPATRQQPILYQSSPQQPVINQSSPQTTQYFATPSPGPHPQYQTSPIQQTQYQQPPRTQYQSPPPPPAQFQPSHLQQHGMPSHIASPPVNRYSPTQAYPQQQFSPPPQQLQPQNRQSMQQFAPPPGQYQQFIQHPQRNSMQGYPPQAAPTGLRPGQPQQRVNTPGKPGQTPQKPVKPQKSAFKKWGKRAAIGLGGIAAVGAVAVGIDVADGELFDGSWFDGLSGGDGSGVEGLGGDGGSGFEDSGGWGNDGGYEDASAANDALAGSQAQLLMEQQGRENALQLLDPVGTTYTEVPVTGTPADLI